MNASDETLYRTSDQAEARRDRPGPEAARSRPALQRLGPDLTYLRLLMVNVYFVGYRDGWALVDAGLPLSAPFIRRAAEERFGRGARPEAIVLTHGHVDHVGALSELADAWDVPIYAHRLELPYLSGRSSYPPPDPSVGGGTMPYLSLLFSRGPFDFGERLRELPEDGSVPGMPGWRWLHTPGHTAGHVSLYREADGALLAGDAVVTVKQESVRAVLKQRQELHGPPAYFTQDWGGARASVERLAALEPRLVASGHGQPIAGEDVARDLDALARYFDALAAPRQGRYLAQPVIADEEGTVALPPAPRRVPLWALGLGVAALAGLALWQRRSRT